MMIIALGRKGEAMDRVKAIKVLNPPVNTFAEIYANITMREENDAVIEALEMARDAPAKPEIVRCSECAFCRPFLSDKVCSLGLLPIINPDIDFCSRAVRKPERRTDADD